MRPAHRAAGSPRRAPASLRLGDVSDLRGPAALAQPRAPGEARRFRGVITDWGGVMTSPIADTVQAWLDAEGIDRDGYAAVMRPWVLAAYDPAGDGNPIHALERGADEAGLGLGRAHLPQGGSPLGTGPAVPGP